MVILEKYLIKYICYSYNLLYLETTSLITSAWDRLVIAVYIDKNDADNTGSFIMIMLQLYFTNSENA